MTADELLAMPDDGAHRYELVRGELIEMSPSGADHSDIALAIGVSLRQFVVSRGLGKVYGADCGFIVTTNPDTVLSPDASFVAAPRALKTSRFFPGPPDLAVEVISPNDRYSDIEAKIERYLRCGTRVVIGVDPQKEMARIDTLTATKKLSIDDTLTASDVLPGWSLPLRDLFA